MSLALQLLSVLLEYPSEDAVRAVPEMRNVVRHSALDAHDRGVVGIFVDQLAVTPLTALQENYVQTFDMSPEHSLHLTHHLFGEDNERGPALIDLTEYYRSFGFEPSESELPDYLPLVLEFAAQLDDAEARLFLARITKIITQLAVNLEQNGSVYAPLMRVVEHQTRLVPVELV